MKSVVVLFAIFALAFANVVDLSADNFDSVVDGSKAAFVEFFAPWCGHCKNLAPVYEQIGEAFAKFNDKVVIAKVDADAHKSLGERFEIRGFPTLKFFPKGSTNPESYEGGRSADDLLSYINNKVGLHARIKKIPSSVVDLTPANFDKVVMDEEKYVLVEFFAPWCGHCKSLAPEYEKLANAFAGEDEVVIAKVDADAHRELGSRFGVTGFPTLKWFSKKDKEPVDYSSGRDLASFINFINNNAQTRRMNNGRLDEAAGRIDAFDDLARKFVAEPASREDILKETEAAAKELHPKEAKLAKIYAKTMSSILSQGSDFIAGEIKRLNRMMEGSVAPKKVDEFTIRKNILASFQ